MGEGGSLLGNQAQQVRWYVAAGIDLLDAEQRRRIGKTPGMDVEHRGDRHIDVAAMQLVGCLDRAEPGKHPHGMQHELAVRIGDGLGLAGGAGGIEGRRPGILVKILKPEPVWRLFHHLVIAGDESQIVFRLRRCIVAQKNQAHLAGHQLHHFGQQRQEIGMDEDHIIFGMVDGIGNLRRRQPDVDCMQHCTNHWHRKETFEIAVCVPVHDSDDLPRPNPVRGESGGETLHTPFEIAIAVTHQTVADRFRSIGRNLQRRAKQALDQ